MRRGWQRRGQKAGWCQGKAHKKDTARRSRRLDKEAERSISDGHHDSDRSTEPDPIVAERP